MTKTSGTIERAPIVVVMGHVDHGKTTLLDYVRKTNVAARETGGITQAVGAYKIEHNGKKITFIDTPGHEAFRAMRAAGATIADLAILVVAADDGPKPQTLEAVRVLTETKTPFIVAVNKIDKPEADLEKAKNELTAAGILLEGYGGQISYHGISAKTGDGVDELLDLVLLAAGVENLDYDPQKPASGYILETKVDNRRGIQASVIITDGTLRVGDFVSTPTARGKVKILEDFLGKSAKELRPSAPALVVSFESLPTIGEIFTASGTEPEAPQRQNAAARPLPQKAKAGEKGESPLHVILKASDAGSLAALTGIMQNLSSEKPLAVVDASVGDITDGDVKTAVATKAVIVGFKNKVNAAAKNLAAAQRVNVVTSPIIYELIQAIEALLKTPEGPSHIGDLEVLAVFNQAKLAKQVIGGKVVEGVFKNKIRFDIVRGDATIGHGKVLNLQQQKRDAESVPAGSEAGLMINAETAIAVGDHLVIKH